jgi:beta-glucanase (GH16 family)
MNMYAKFSMQLVILALTFLSYGTALGQSQYNRLVWSDEFNNPGLPDSTKWSYDLGTGCPNNCGWGNNELEYYTNRPENAVVQDGMLKIMLRKEPFKGSAYTSAKLVSKGKYAFTYGKVEAKAKLPEGKGTWPAIWMLGSNIGKAGWPACGEIDIMEHRGFEPDKIFGTLHYPGHSGANADGNTKMISNATGQFHVYAMEWSATEIKIFVDNQLCHTVANSTGSPFNQDFFLILNVAIGGGFGGPVDPAFTISTMEVDYIRVYQ